MDSTPNLKIQSGFVEQLLYCLVHIMVYFYVTHKVHEPAAFIGTSLLVVGSMSQKLKLDVVA